MRSHFSLNLGAFLIFFKLNYNPSFPLFCVCDILAGQLMVVYSILLVDLSPTFYCLPKPLCIRVWFDGTIIDISTILLQRYSRPKGLLIVGNLHTC